MADKKFPKLDQIANLRAERYERGQQANKDAAAIAALREKISSIPVKRAPRTKKPAPPESSAG